MSKKVNYLYLHMMSSNFLEEDNYSFLKNKRCAVLSYDVTENI